MKRMIAFLLVLTMLLSALAGCTGPGTEPKPTEPAATQDASQTEAADPGEEYDIPPEEGCNKLTFYWYNE